MNSAVLSSLRRFAAVALLAALAPIARAQHLLVVMDDDKPLVVVGAHGMWPEVMEEGKLRTIHGNRFALLEHGEYLPLYVAVRHPQVKTSAVMMNAGEGTINREFHFYGELETAYTLDDVYLVIVLKNDRGEKGLFLFEVGQLESRVPRQIDLVVPMQLDSAPGHYDLYMFTRGRELFQTMMPIGAMEQALNRMVAERIRDLRDAPPQPFVGPEPEYPRALLKQKVSGSATIGFRLDARGRAWEPVVVAASRPEFGEAALAVINDWRFLPKVRNGRPVETKVELPFDFSPPAAK